MLEECDSIPPPVPYGVVAMCLVLDCAAESYNPDDPTSVQRIHVQGIGWLSLSAGTLCVYCNIWTCIDMHDNKFSKLRIVPDCQNRTEFFQLPEMSP